MKQPSDEPPPLPKSRVDGNVPNEWIQERSNQILLLASIPLALLIALMMLAMVWSFSQPKGLGNAIAGSASGEGVTTMGSSGLPKPAGSQEKSGDHGGSEQKEAKKAGADETTSPGIRDRQDESTSEAEGKENEKVEESIIQLPSGKVSSDAKTVALEDPFNPFLESATGKEIVYVIDISGSMAGGLYDRVATELIEAIQGLKPSQKFNIILFSTTFSTFRDDGLISASKEAKDAATVWLRSQFCGGGTDPSPAIEFAIQLAPEKIVVLSDGEFDAGIPAYVTGLNQSLQATIDCIGFDPQSFTLKEIAKSNGPGRFYAVR
jgi:hypothetical protein